MRRFRTFIRPASVSANTMTISLTQSQKDALVEALKEEYRCYDFETRKNDFHTGLSRAIEIVESFQTSESSGFKEAALEEIECGLCKNVFSGRRDLDACPKCGCWKTVKAYSKPA